MKPLPKNFKFSRDPRFTPEGISDEMMTAIEKTAILLVEADGAKEVVGSGTMNSAGNGTFYKGQGQEMADCYIHYFRNFDPELEDGYYANSRSIGESGIPDIGLRDYGTPEARYLKTCCNYVLACRKCPAAPSPTRGAMKYGYDYGTY